MFLNLLSNSEKEAFLEMAVQLANSDLDFSVDEANIINQYRVEMNLSEQIYTIKGLHITQCINLFSSSTKQTRNIVYFELLGLALCDENFGSKEVEFMDKVRDSFGIDRNKISEMVNCINNLTEIYKKINGLFK